MTAVQTLTAARWASSRAIRLHPDAFPPAVAILLRAELAVEHAADPFSPTEPRVAARRVADIAQRVGLNAIVYRGGLDVVGAELDHVWAVVEQRVIDPGLPLFSSRFVDAVRAYVAGDLGEEELERAARPFTLSWRVVGDFPDVYRYVGAPVWGAAG